jgi:hypothetical protein
MDDIYEIYKALKVKNKKYLVRMYWMQNEQRYRNTKYIYGWHPIED